MINMDTELKNYKIFLADDDLDDCNSFSESIEELQLSSHLTIVHDGEQLMELLNETENFPDIIFLDLNMPRKSGFECLKEIKQNNTINIIPIIIISTTLDNNTINRLYKDGASHFIQKPSDFSQLTNLIYTALNSVSMPRFNEQVKEKFVILPQATVHGKK